jgi:hypothetical protein
MRVGNHKIPNRGDEVEQRRIGVSRVGAVWYADQLQVLVKWQDGKSSSLRLGRDRFSIRTGAAEDARSLNGSPSAERRSDGERHVEAERGQIDAGHIRRNRLCRALGPAIEREERRHH